MRTISFNKQGIKCPKCGQNPVARWNQLCEDCQKVQGAPSKTVGEKLNSVGKRVPAAVLQNEKGERIFVDKFGNEVKNHGYNLDDDPRGYHTTGTVKNKPTII